MDLTKHVPPEILTEIFEQLYFLSLDPQDPASENSRRIRQLCWPISQVCNYWRQVALAMPCLWAHLPLINLDNTHSKRFTGIPALLRRCKDAPLHVSLSLSPHEFLNDAEAIHQELVAHAKRWKTLTVCSDIAGTEVILRDLSTRFTRLEDLSLCVVQNGLDHGVLDMFETAPKLRSITLSGDATGWALLVDTKSLVHLNDKMGAFMHTLHPYASDDYPVLTTLRLRDTGIFDYSELSEDAEEIAVELPALKTLDYFCSDRIEADGTFLQFPITRALEELSVDAFNGDVLALLMDLCDRSGPMPLHTLRLSIDMEGYNGQFTDLLAELPQLEVLEVDLPCIEDIELLSVVTGPEVLVPKLRKCAFRFHKDNFDGINLQLTRLTSARCVDGAAPMELSIKMELSSLFERDGLGFGQPTYQYLILQPTRLEPWYGEPYPRQPWEGSDLPRSPYTEAEATIPGMLLMGRVPIRPKSWEYKHTLELLTAVEKRYNKPSELVKFLETNTNICLIALAYVLKTQLPDQQKARSSPFKRAIRILKKVREDLMERLDDFHWIWETSLTDISIRYIPDGHEMRKDREAFANAVIGITDDPWVLDEF